MAHSFRAVHVSDNVYWVGAVDWAVRDFHGYLTSRGTTYNAYLVTGDKTVLIDTVKAPFRDEMVSRIASVIEPTRIDYIISNHSEMDHSGCLPAIIDLVGPEKVFASPRGVKALAAHFHLEREIEPVKDGQEISLGDRIFVFLETRMLHWPESMVTYLPSDRLLFSQDGFGMHLASSERFADEIDPEVLEWEGAKYYANILLPYSALITRLLDRIARSGLEIDVIAPDHGPIWRKNLGKILGYYADWASQRPAKKAVVTFATMWQSTALMARAIAEAMVEEGISARVMPLGADHRSDIVTEILDAGALVVGSPTLNNNVFPSMSDLLTYLKGLKPANLIGGAFGSYGWSGEATKQIREMLLSMKVELVGEDVKVQYVPDGEALEKCAALGGLIGRTLRERCE